MREPLSPGQLYSRLNDEWQRLRPSGCGKCRMPLPVLVSRPDEVSANWRIGAAPWCARHCHQVISEVAGSMWPLYDLVEY